MKRVVRRFVPAAFALSLLIGCARPVPAPVPQIGGPSGVITWLPTNTDNPVPGVDRATVVYEGPAIVVWSDFADGGGSSSSANSQRLTGSGHVQSRDGRRVTF